MSDDACRYPDPGRRLHAADDAAVQRTAAGNAVVKSSLYMIRESLRAS